MLSWQNKKIIRGPCGRVFSEVIELFVNCFVAGFFVADLFDMLTATDFVGCKNG